MSPQTRKTILAAVIGAGLALVLQYSAMYLLWPDHTLNREAGWLSYRGDRAWRIDLLLRLGADPNKLGDERGYAPIHSAAHWGNANVIRQLIGHGANPNLRTAAGKTPLDLACAYGQPAVPVLVEFGATTSSGAKQCEEER